MNWRKFLGTAATTVAASRPSWGAGATIGIVRDPADRIANMPQPVWAVKHLEEKLAQKGAEIIACEKADQASSASLSVVITTTLAPAARLLAGTVAAVPDALGIGPAQIGKQPAVIACGQDARGLTYALLELADRVEHSATPAEALRIANTTVERPANKVRSIARLFTSDLEDKAWFNDREMWREYLTMLAAQRFNRFNLSFGIGYDFLREVTDAYFLFAYPFFLAVPGHKVQVSGLPDAKRDRNLEMLKFISTETTARGMEFQLGIWTHGYQWINSPRPNHTIEGLTAANHAAYCRDAVSTLLKEVPHITGVNFRVHGESGVEEGSYDFWKTVFEGVVRSGRKVEIDMHAKGMDDTMLKLATDTGLPVKVSPKYWAEHLGMPYHQADIRQQEVPRPDRQASGLMKFSAGSRSFLRYGYGDLLREDRRWGILHRIWPGTQRLLLWGDPVTAAAYSRAFSFCDSDGVEIMEPLSFKGRRGSGYAGNRTAYADPSLRPRWDWQKYLYTYRVWGRHLYNPDCDPDVGQRYFRTYFGAKAEAAETALAHASRILPTITTAHGASAANNTYWPEVYTNQPIVNPDRPHPYRDTPSPRTFGNVSPFDPQLFARVSDFAEELVTGRRSGKYSPLEVAQWIEEYAAAAAKALARVNSSEIPEERRLYEDVSIQCGLGRFFAHKLRAGVLYGIFERTGDRTALAEALKAYRAARDVWSDFANRAKSVYVADITIGERKELRRHWLDRLTDIDGDIEDMAAKLTAASTSQPGNERAKSAIREVLGRVTRPSIPCRHAPPQRFRRGQTLDIEIAVSGRASVRLHYRHVNHAERWEAVNMQAGDDRYRAAIPASYTDSPYPLEYYFELRDAPDRAWLYPGFNSDRTNPPYFVVRQA